jgi:hypothetical protein
VHYLIWKHRAVRSAGFGFIKTLICVALQIHSGVDLLFCHGYSLLPRPSRAGSFDRRLHRCGDKIDDWRIDLQHLLMLILQIGLMFVDSHQRAAVEERFHQAA